MTPMILIWFSLVGFAFMVFSAMAVRILQDTKWHDLEEYCEKRNQIQRFRNIHENHEEAALASECLQVLGTAIFLIAGQVWLLKSEFSIDLSTSAFITDALVVTSILLVFTVWLPWAVAEYFAPAFIYYTWSFWLATSKLLLPLAWGSDLFESMVRRLAGIEKEAVDEEEEFEDEVRAIVTEGLREGLLEEDAREMIEGIMELDDSDAADIMTPRSQISAVKFDAPWDKIITTISSTGRTRIPIYRNSLDEIVGIAYVKDLLPELVKLEPERKSLEQLARKASHVPTTMPVDELLKHFLKDRTHMALVVDEYHAVAGLVTIEDVLEEIVGEIVDEHDIDVEAEIIQLSETVAEVSGRAHIDDINDALGFELPENEQYDTVAGMVIAKLQKIPKAGDQLRIGEIELEVLEADRRRIQKLRLTSAEQLHPRSG